MSALSSALLILREAQTEMDIEVMRSMITSAIFALQHKPELRADMSFPPLSHSVRTEEAVGDIPPSGGLDNLSYPAILYECVLACTPGTPNDHATHS